MIKRTLFLIIATSLMLASSSAYQLGGPLPPPDHDWTVNGYGIINYGSKTYALLKWRQVPIPLRFDLAVILSGVVGSLCAVGGFLAIRTLWEKSDSEALTYAKAS